MALATVWGRGAASERARAVKLSFNHRKNGGILGMAPLIKVGGSLAAPKTDHLQLDHLAPLGSLSTMATGSLVTMHLVVGWVGWVG